MANHPRTTPDCRALAAAATSPAPTIPEWHGEATGAPPRRAGGARPHIVPPWWGVAARDLAFLPAPVPSWRGVAVPPLSPGFEGRPAGLGGAPRRAEEVDLDAAA